MFGGNYTSYKNALKTLYQDPLSVRRDSMCLTFAREAEKHPKHSIWFKLDDNQVNTRQTKYKYKEVLAKHDRFEKNPINLCLAHAVKKTGGKVLYYFVNQLRS
jgi:hypothetical protein